MGIYHLLFAVFVSFCFLPGSAFMCFVMMGASVCNDSMPTETCMFPREDVF